MVVTSGKCLAYTFRVLSATILLVLLNASGNQAVSLLTYSLEVNNGMAITLCESNDATMVSMADDLHPNISEWFQKNRNNSVTTYWIAHSDCPNNGCAMMDNNHTMECVQCSDKRLVFCKKERPCQYVKNVTSALRELIQEDNLNDCEHNCCTKTKCVGWSFTANGCYHYNSTLDTTTEGTIANTKQPLNIIEHYVRNSTSTGEPEAYTNFEICEGIEESSYLSEMSTQTPYFSSSVESTAEMTSMLTYSSSYETGISSLTSFINATSCSSSFESTQIPSDVQTTSNWPEKTSTGYSSFSVFSTTLEIYSSTTQSLDCNGGACTSNSNSGSSSSGSSNNVETTSENVEIGGSSNSFGASSVGSNDNLSFSSTIVSSSTRMCKCQCPVSQTIMNEEAKKSFQRKMSSVAAYISIPKKNLSATIRRKTSAQDDRPSAQGIGYIGVAFLGAVFGGLILMDLGSLANQFVILYRNLTGR